MSDTPRQPRVTLLTIADELGVSRTTVSNAYSRPDQLTKELRERILEAAARLGYRGPSPAGRLLRTGRIGTKRRCRRSERPFAVTGQAGRSGCCRPIRPCLRSSA